MFLHRMYIAWAFRGRCGGLAELRILIVSKIPHRCNMEDWVYCWNRTDTMLNGYLQMINVDIFLASKPE